MLKAANTNNLCFKMLTRANHCPHGAVDRRVLFAMAHSNSAPHTDLPWLPAPFGSNTSVAWRFTLALEESSRGAGLP